MTRRFTSRQLVLGGIFIVAFAIHAASLSVFVRYYAPSFVFEFSHGFATLYWGGDREVRNSYIYNVSEWPLRPDTVFAGQDWPDGMRWEVYNPSAELGDLSEGIQNSGFLRAFGYSLPQLRRDDEATSILIPLGSLTFIVEVCILILMVRGWWPNKSPEPTAVGAVSSAVAVHVTSRRWLSFGR